ncbi:MAG: hypothetical protein ABIH09_02385, partial [Candidatus Omnitrophota bacterium]
KLETKTWRLDDDQVLSSLAIIQCELQLCDQAADVIKKIKSKVSNAVLMLRDFKIARRIDGFKEVLRIVPYERLNYSYKNKRLIDWIYEEVSSLFEVLHKEPGEHPEAVALLGRDVGRCAICLRNIAKFYLSENYSGIDSKRKVMEIIKKLETKTWRLDDDQVLSSLAIIQCELQLCEQAADVIEKLSSEALRIELLKDLVKAYRDSGDLFHAKIKLKDLEALIENRIPHPLAKIHWPDIKGNHLLDIKAIKETLDGESERTRLNDTDITMQAEFLRHSLIEWQKEHPKEMLLIAIDDDIGKDQDSFIEPLWKIIDAIKEMTDEEGKPLFTDKTLKTVRRSAGNGDLMREINQLLKSEEKLVKDNIFLVAKQENSDAHLFDKLKGTSWIAAINDSKTNMDVYIPVFEALTLTIMSSLNADIESIKSFYDKIVDTPVSKKFLEQMIENKMLYILPRMDRKCDNIREKYDIVRNIYQAV